jgi:hypothetical protein
MTLRWQASVTIDTPGQQWLLDNDSENPQNFNKGYTTFLLILNGSELDVYGTSVRIAYLGNNNKLEYDTETCEVTVLTATNMDIHTVCPNGKDLSTNQGAGGGTWNEWMRASAPPKPPACVPTDYSYCPPTKRQATKTDPDESGQ